MKNLKYLLLLAALAACGDDNDTDDMGTVGLALDHGVGGHALALDQIQYTNAAGNEYGVSRLEYIISHVHLEDSDGNSFMLAPQHYRDAASGSTRMLLNDEVPAGTYTALTFRFGSRAEAGALSDKVHFANMEWPEPLGGGYHYMKFEGLFHGDDGESPFAVHAGPSGGDDFSFDVALPINLTVDGDAWEINLVMDLNEWFVHPNTYNFADYGGIMGNPGAQTIIRDNGTDAFSVSDIEPLDLDAIEHAGHDDGAEDHDDGAEDHSEHM